MRYLWLLNRLAHIVIATALFFVAAGILVMDTLIILWGVERNSSVAAWIGISCLIVFVTVLSLGIIFWFIVWVMNKIPDVAKNDVPTPYERVSKI